MVSQLCDTIAVMYSGQIVEVGRAADVLAHPQHPYTKALLASIPSFTPREDGNDTLSAIPGMYRLDCYLLSQQKKLRHICGKQKK